MSAEPATPAARDRRWIVAVAGMLAVLVFARLRSEVPLYVELHRWLDARDVPASLRHLDGSLLIAGAALFAARLAWGRGGACRGLGLRAPLPVALWFALVSGLPMLLQAMLASDGVRWDWQVVRGVVLAPLVEEASFRAVLVGITVRLGGRRFWPTAVLAAALFGSMHVPWSAAFHSGHLGILAATIAGGVWYAWILRAHDWNLWTTILLHAVMNGAWMVFGAADDAAGGLWPNVGRGLTIVVGTVLTIRRLRRRRAADA
ncbi:MAG: CPBP family intramembrane metalloprotease [Planctomycetes bacterium]|nr:CPBP family intramembrane metalloprotease [Planctomycetota bacterium]